MRTIFLALMFISTISFAQNSVKASKLQPVNQYVKSVDNLTLDAAFEMAKRATASAATFDKKISIAVLDASGVTILLIRGEGVGPHNTEAARRKAYTALSTKTPTLSLLRNAAANPDSKNLNTLPELLLLSGATPVWYKGNIIGSIGVAGGGSAENDDLIAKAAAIPELGITTIQ